MRRRYLLILVVPAVLLLALGALPALLGGGETYYVVATEVDLEGGEPPHENATETFRAENLSENRFPYTLAALEDGVSEPYEEGRIGAKEWFTHTPFDEFAEFEARPTDGTADGRVWIERNGTYYRLEITDDPDDRSERVAGDRIGD